MDQDALAPVSPGGFQPTRWSVVLASAQTQVPGARDALTSLCKTYWQPLYAYVRRRGYDHHRSQDTIQEFFLSLIENKTISRADPAKGKFRSYLLGSLERHMATTHQRATTQKRGGGLQFVSLEVQAQPEVAPVFSVNSGPPEAAFEREWAVATVEAAIAHLEQDFERRRKHAIFSALKPYLIEEPPAGAYEEISRTLRISVNSVRVGVHRLRHQFRLQLRREVAKTVDMPDQIDEEMSHLREVLTQRQG